MKKYLIAGFLIILAGWYATSALFTETKTITVPVTVYQGDSISGICIELAEKYSDTRNYKEISYYAQKKNNVGRYIYPGKKLYIELEVPVEQRKEK